MKPAADLHIHTYYSDGSQSPAEVVDEAARCGLSVIAITDHDAVDGVPEAVEAGRACGLEVIAGIEMSAEAGGKDVHILAYFVDTASPALQTHLQTFQTARQDRVRGMIALLEAEGIRGITFDEVQAMTRSRAVGRLHLATVLARRGLVASTREAFDKYLNEGAPAFLPKFRLSPREAVAVIRAAGGVAVMAHPMVTNRDDLIPELVDAGLGGMEVYYPNWSANTIHRYEQIARHYQLVMTGGSDAHGTFKTNTSIGRAGVALENVEALRARAGQG